jgi:hypothetical protein
VSFTGSTMGKYSRLWLIITGVILLAVGAVLIVALGSVPFAGGTMLLTGGILAIVGLGLIVVGFVVGQRSAQVDRLLSTGVPGTAQVTSVTQTGMYLNEQPQLELDLLVNVPGRAPYAATHKSFVPLMLMSRVTSGMPLSVVVDPANPRKVVVNWQKTGFGRAMQPMAGMQPMQATSVPATQAGVDETLRQVEAALASTGSAAAAPFASADQGGYSVDQLRQYLRTSGLPAQARIDKLTDTGQIVGDERLYTMQATLEIPGQPPRVLAESAAMVPLTAMHKVRVGAVVPVRYAAENLNLLMFEWEKI